MRIINKLLVCYIILMSPINGYAQDDTVSVSDVDFIHYHAELEPNFKEKSLKGTVKVKFVPRTQKLRNLTFSAKYKQIKSVYIDGKVAQYLLSDEQLTVNFQQELEINRNYSLKVEYSATPKRGMKFYDDHIFTVYHTKNWLVSHNNISDKSTFDLVLTHDANMTTVGNGRLVSRKVLENNKVISHWQQDMSMPLYTFGFAIGKLETLTIKTNSADIVVLYRAEHSSGLTPKLIKEAFADVADMLSFYESKAGFSLNQNSYNYVVVDGYMAQEASGFSLVGEKFVHTVLEDENENWFIAHELAHEWWGNSVTCANFSHFWLNEGLVQFLVAVYKQHLFGEQAYKNELNVAVRRVERAVKENRVAPVAFHDEIEEQEINRTMAYSKGALVFYMLREKLGDEFFWKALKQYTQTYKNKSVTTQNLKFTIEQISGTDLTHFFDKWVYGQEIPNLNL
ncbi:MAG: M1 family metallopeptidase [Litorilituus sp.]|nr:M1 family metallopeptidase [Litorilituus sp.]